MASKDLSRTESYRYATGPVGADRPQISRLEKPFVRDKERLKRDRRDAKLRALRQELDFVNRDHSIPLEDLYENFGYPKNEDAAKLGLSTRRANELLRDFGPNVLRQPDLMPEWVRFSKHLFGGFNVILWIAAMFAFVAYALTCEWYENVPTEPLFLGLVLLVVLTAIGLFGYLEEYYSFLVVKSFTKLLPSYTNVIRDGVRSRVRTDQLVPGDVVLVCAGDVVPADLRIIEINIGSPLKTDMSNLTGESDAVYRSDQPTNENPLETRNLLFYSNRVVEGSAKCIVLFTGNQCVLGRIANLVAETDVTNTSVTQEMSDIVQVMSLIGGVFSIVWLSVAFCLPYTWLDVVYLFMGVAVAFIPEGLLPAVTMCLAISARKMASKNCVARSLGAVETVGATSAILTDKTGCITKKSMRPARLWLDGRPFDCVLPASAGEAPPVALYHDLVTFNKLLRVAAVCNRAEFKEPIEVSTVIEKRECYGEPDDVCLLKFAEQTLYDRLGLPTAGETDIVSKSHVADLRARYRIACEVAFNQVSKFHATVCELPPDDNDARGPTPCSYMVLLKGAPERVFERCQFISVNGEARVIDEKIRNLFAQALIDYGTQGERLLGFAELPLPEAHFPRGAYGFDPVEGNFPLTNLCFLGLLTEDNPPRPEVPNAVAKCRSAGIKVVMITGDHPYTAKAIAKQVGIIGANSRTVEDIAAQMGIQVKDVNIRDANAAVVHGPDMRDMTPTQLDAILTSHEEVVFARIDPRQKASIVEAAKRAGLHVACTADSVREIGALRRADVGVAFQSGSDWSKQTADLVLLDDSFGTLVQAIEDGRVIFDNLKKVIVYSFTTNLAEIVPMFLFWILNIPLPLSLLACLYIDVGTDFLPAVSFAFEDAENDLMKQRPRDLRRERLVSRALIAVSYGQMGVVQTLAGLFIYLVVLAQNGFWPNRLILLRFDWDTMCIQDLEDSYGQEWSFTQRKSLEHTCQSAYFATIVVVQWTMVIVYKTRRNSVLLRGLNNVYMLMAMVFETALALFLIYVPGFNQFFLTSPLRFSWWLPPLVFGLLIFFYDEVRKWFMRRHPGGVLQLETGW